MLKNMRRREDSVIILTTFSKGARMIRSLAVVVVTALLGSVALAADPPAAKDEGYTLGEVRNITFPSVQYISGSAQTTFDKMMEVIGKYMPMLTKGADEGTIRPMGCGMFVYKGMTEDMSKPFTLEIGWIVSDKTKDQGELKVRKTEPFKCATILYTGPVATIGKAYEKLMPAVDPAKRTGESRELYLYWEGPESTNNIVQIQIGVK
jgi:hypothetical protein